MKQLGKGDMLMTEQMTTKDLVNIRVKKNDVVRVDLSGSIDSEQGKERYAVVIQNNIGNTHSPTTIIMPLTHKLKGLHIPTHTVIKPDKENGLKVDSVLLGEQVRVISKRRILKHVGHISDNGVINEIQRVCNVIF